MRSRVCFTIVAACARSAVLVLATARWKSS